MPVCDYCGKELNIVYICERCGSSFCRKHKHPEIHDCSQKNTLKINGFAISYDNEVRSSNIEYQGIIDDSIGSEEPSVIMGLEIDKPKKERDNENENIQKEKNKPKISSNISVACKGGKKTFPFVKSSVVLVIFLLFSILGNGFLYFEYRDYVALNKNYVGLFDTTTKLQLYYDNLTSQYMELREEYSQLNRIYSESILSKAELEKEHSDIMNYRKNIQLVNQKTITLQPNQNYTEIHTVPFSGFINLNYSSTSGIYTWIGSSSLEPSYYSRNPQFPQTSTSLNFTVPVLPDIVIYLANPNVDPVTVTYWVHYIY